MANEWNWKVLDSNKPLNINGTNYFISKQENTENKTNCLVIKKQSMNEDGSTRGGTKQLFITWDDAQEVLQSAINFINK